MQVYHFLKGKEMKVGGKRGAGQGKGTTIYPEFIYAVFISHMLSPPAAQDRATHWPIHII